MDRYQAYSSDLLEEYFAISYLRLSKVDRRKSEESDSIANQRKLVQSYVERHPNITLVEEAYDDGYTGTNYDRPGFQKVLEAIKSGRVNCVIVKDLSRLGREYISTGKYIEKVFPGLGVRFIAINDDVDTENEKTGDELLIPIKNIMNETYCRELSKKLRRQFRIQRSNGEFLGAFASYGYWKSPDDKHKLIVDECAAEVVKGIFSLKIKGYSAAAIAEYLNSELVPPPSEYKRNKGLNYRSGFISADRPKWSAVTVTRILTNPIYTGTLIQGKRGTPNYKVKSMHVRKESEWSVIHSNHPAIIDPIVFAAVQRMLGRDTRTAPTEESVYPLSGVLFCQDCGRAMRRRTATKNGKKYYYYVCAAYKSGQGCSSHSIECSTLDAIILNAIAHQVNMIAEMEGLLRSLGQKDIWEIKARGYDEVIEQKEAELERNMQLQMGLYESLTSGVLNREEYDLLKGQYKGIIATCERDLRQLRASRDEARSKAGTGCDWVAQFLKFQGIESLSREAVFTLIDKVYVYEDKHIRIDFNFRNEIDFCFTSLNRMQKEVS